MCYVSTCVWSPPSSPAVTVTCASSSGQPSPAARPCLPGKGAGPGATMSGPSQLSLCTDVLQLWGKDTGSPTPIPRECSPAPAGAGCPGKPDRPQTRSHHYPQAT